VIAGTRSAWIAAAIPLAVSGVVTVFIGTILSALLAPFIVIPIVLGAFQLREALRLVKVGPSGSTLVGVMMGMITGCWLAFGEGDGFLPWRAIGVVVLVTWAVGLWLALRWSHRSAASP
jgi:hypothetical protein